MTPHCKWENRVETDCLSYKEKINLLGFMFYKFLYTTWNISNWKLLKEKTGQTKQVKLLKKTQ